MIESKRNVSCVVVTICDSDAVVRCVARLRVLEPPPHEIVVCAAASFDLPRELETARDLNIVRIAEDSPVALAAAGIAASRGEIICMTEDHCLPVNGWINELSAALDGGSCAAAGGPIDRPSDGTSFDWAFFIVDFFRYLPPVKDGAVNSLSVCNVAYRRETLNMIQSEWSPGFHETRVHDLLKASGRLRMVGAAGVTSNRSVGMRDGLRERFTFGRLFAAKRFRSGDAGRRIAFAAGSIVLPLLLYARIARRCSASPDLMLQLVKASPHVVLLLLAWTLGELVGYVTGRADKSSPAARNRSARSGGQPVNA